MTRLLALLSTPDAATAAALWAAISTGALSLFGLNDARRAAKGVLLAMLSALLCVALLYGGVPSAAAGSMQRTAWGCAALAAGSAMAAAVLTSCSRAPRGHALAGAARTVALLLGTIAGTVEAVILAMRLVDAGLETLTGALSFIPASYGFTMDGRCVFALLAIALTSTLITHHDRRLPAALVWLAAGAAAWECLLEPVLDVTMGGRIVRTAVGLRLMGGLSVVLGFACVLYSHTRRVSGRDIAATADDWPAYRFTCGVLGMAVLVLAAFHLTVPTSVAGGHRFAALLGGACTGACAAGLALLIRRQWDGRLVETAMGLVSLSVCVWASTLLPGQPVLLATRFPLVFMATVVGMSLATLAWTTAAGSLPPPAEGLPEDAVRRDFRVACKRFAFLTAALGVLVAALLALWPTQPGIATTEDTLERFGSGLGVHLLLLIVLLWCGRRLKRLTFHLLTLLAAGSTLGFAVVRMWPWART